MEELDQLYSSLQQSGHLDSAEGPLKLVLKERVKFGAQLKRLTALLAEGKCPLHIYITDNKFGLINKPNFFYFIFIIGGAIDNPIVLEDTESSNHARNLQSQEAKPAGGIVARKKPELIVLRDSPEVSEEAGAANGGAGEEEAGSGDLDS